ncbi:MAG TPA: SRPBCC family protein [Roseiflexaceae bacterium]|nr:SRPBCC family protein [Roseiflexaceae bacterium]
MARIHAGASALIDAPPATVYAILADYQGAHPQILPPQFFTGLEVEAGGQGAGTIFRTGVRVLGRETRFRMEVREPQPGRVLSETDLATGLTTTFTVTPTAEGRQSVVEIATVWEGGILERLTTPLIMRRIYQAELALLARYVDQAGGKR